MGREAREVGGPNPGTDSTARVQALLSRLLHPAFKFESFAEELTRSAAEALDLDRASLWRFEDESTRLRCVVEQDRRSGTIRRDFTVQAKDLATYLPAIEDSRILAVRESTSDPAAMEWATACPGQADAVSTLDIALPGSPDLWGILRFDHRGTPRAWTPAERSLAATFAHLATTAARLGASGPSDAELTRRFEEQSLLLNHSRDIVYRLDRSGTLTYVSPSIEPLTGHTVADWLDHYTKFMTDNPLNRQALEITERNLRTGERSSSHIIEIYHRNGRRIHLECVERAFWDGGRVAGIIGVARDATDRIQTEQELRAIVEGTSAATGETFFRQLARNLASALNVKHALLARCVGDPPERARVLVWWSGNEFSPPADYELEHTPCRKMLNGESICFPRGVQALFPEDRFLAETGAESYLGVPLKNAAGAVIGHVVVLDDKPLEDEDRRMAILRVFAARAGAELEREETERKLAALAEEQNLLLTRTRDVVFRQGRDGRMHYVSPAIETITGYAPDSWLRHYTETLTDNPINRAVIENTERSLETGEPSDPYLIEIRARDGRPVMLEINETPYYEDDKIAGLIGVARDVTERTRAERALQESEERLRDYLDNAHDSIAVITPEFEIRYVNRSLRELLGHSSDALLGKSGWAILHPESHARVRGLVERALSREEVRFTDVEMLHAEGRTIITEGTVACKFEDEKPASLHIVFRDVTAERRAQEALQETRERVIQLEEQVRSRVSFENLVGKSAPMQEIFRRIRLSAQSDVTVLITGESGTGKELAASAIHARSLRRGKPFVAVNCSAIPETLLESEIFGHVRGAFTGATRDKVGLLEAAQGGTLFLDEIGDMSPALQVKLLRVLQEREYRRVGDDGVRQCNIRLLTATNRDLPALLASGELREDFYYRIRVFQIHLPPLRERREDLPLLVAHFMEELSKARDRDVREISEEAMRHIVNHSWPGNVRELRNAIEHAFVTIQSDRVGTDDLPREVRDAAPLAASPFRVKEIRDRERIVAALREAGGNRTAAAKSLGISRVTLWKKLKKLEIGSA